MPVNSISPSQPAVSQLSKVAETSAARKKSDVQESNRVKDRSDALDRQAELRKVQEANKPAVNTSGQKIGTRIDVSA